MTAWTGGSAGGLVLNDQGIVCIADECPCATSPMLMVVTRGSIAARIIELSDSGATIVADLPGRFLDATPNYVFMLDGTQIKRWNAATRTIDIVEDLPANPTAEHDDDAWTTQQPVPVNITHSASWTADSEGLWLVPNQIGLRRIILTRFNLDCTYDDSARVLAAPGQYRNWTQGVGHDQHRRSSSRIGGRMRIAYGNFQGLGTVFLTTGLTPTQLRSGYASYFRTGPSNSQCAGNYVGGDGLNLYYLLSGARLRDLQSGQDRSRSANAHLGVIFRHNNDLNRFVIASDDGPAGTNIVASYHTDSYLTPTQQVSASTIFGVDRWLGPVLHAGGKYWVMAKPDASHAHPAIAQFTLGGTVDWVTQFDAADGWVMSQYDKTFAYLLDAQSGMGQGLDKA